MSEPIRIGVDVGGTFTKAVAIETGAAAAAGARGRSRPRTPPKQASPRASPTRCGRLTRGARRGTRARRAGRLLDDAGDECTARGRRRTGWRPRHRRRARPPRSRASARTWAPSRSLPGHALRDRARIPRRDRRPRTSATSTPRWRTACRRRLRRSRRQRRSRRRRRRDAELLVAALRSRTRAACVRRPRPQGRIRARDAHRERRRERAASFPSSNARPPWSRRRWRTSGLDVPLLVLRGDGGAMSVEAFRQAPLLHASAPGPAAGVGRCPPPAPAVRRDRRRVRRHELERLGRQARPPGAALAAGDGPPDGVRAVDSWVVGAAGGEHGPPRSAAASTGTGPRSAHIAGLAVRLLRRRRGARGRRARARRAARRRSGGLRLRARRRALLRAHRHLRCATPSDWSTKALLVRRPRGGAGRVRAARPSG